MATQPNPDVISLLTRIAEAGETQTALLREISGKLDALTERPAGQLPAAAGAPAGDQPTAVFRDFTADTLIMTYDDKGQPAYKFTGHPYNKYGVRAWPEVLPALGIDPTQLKPGPNPVSLPVRALLSEDGKPRKIIGPAAPGAAQPARATRPAAPTPPELEPPF